MENMLEPRSISEIQQKKSKINTSNLQNAGRFGILSVLSSS